MSKQVLERVTTSPSIEAAPKPIKVCYLIDNLAVGGTEKQLLALIAHLDRSQVRPYLCLLDGMSDSSRALEPEDCPVVRLGVKSLKSMRAIPAAWQFIRFLRQQQIDVVQLHFPDSTYFGAPLARAAGVPRVILTQRNLGHWMTDTHKCAARLMSRLSHATIANSNKCKEVAIECGAHPERVYVIPNSIDVGQFGRRYIPTATERRDMQPCVGVVANLRHVKNLDVFISAAAGVIQRHPLARFEIAGDGPLRASIERQIREAGLQSSIALLGHVDNIPQLLQRWNVAVLPSASEGCPNALLEYMASGCPIVATRVGGIPELIEDGVHGLIVEPNDVSAIAEAISCLLADADWANRMSAAVLIRVHEYRPAKLVSDMCDRYREILGWSA